MIHESCIPRLPCETLIQFHQLLVSFFQEVSIVYTISGKSLHWLSHVAVNLKSIRKIQLLNGRHQPVNSAHWVAVWADSKRMLSLNHLIYLQSIDGLYLVVHLNTRNCLYILFEHTEITI